MVGITFRYTSEGVPEGLCRAKRLNYVTTAGVEDYDRIQRFKSVLDKNGIPCTIRLKRGIDIVAGCGQLVTEQSK